MASEISSPAEIRELITRLPYRVLRDMAREIEAFGGYKPPMDYAGGRFQLAEALDKWARGERPTEVEEAIAEAAD